MSWVKVDVKTNKVVSLETNEPTLTPAEKGKVRVVEVEEGDEVKVGDEAPAAE
jgi:multidrug efflux pump subunit AcrA (membrane-fusion protein)